MMAATTSGKMATGSTLNEATRCLPVRREQQETTGWLAGWFLLEFGARAGLTTKALRPAD